MKFWKAKFGDGQVDFKNAKFGKGPVSFDNATFGNGPVSFDNAIFDEGDISFQGAMFDGGKVTFQRVTFAKGPVIFDYATFGNGSVKFDNASFDEGDISFESATFYGGDVSFYDVTLGEGNVYFLNTAFGQGRINFNHTDLEKGSLTFLNTRFNENDISFENANLSGNFQLRNCKNTQTLVGLSFRAMRLTGTFNLEDSFNCVPDLRSTALATHVDLENLKIEAEAHQLKSPEDDKSVAGDPNIARLRRLKELAEQNRHHEAALHFFAMERRVARHTKAMSPGAAVLDYIYELACDLGQSILQPMICLLMSFSLYAVGYHYLSTGVSFGTAAKAALVGAVPFLPLVRLKDNPLAKIVGDPANDALYFLAVGEQLFCFVFLFLLGVSLRNRFRL